MRHDPDIAQVLARLEASLAQAALPAKVHAAGQSLVTRLATPVRIGLFGLPGAGKRECLNAIVGEDILAPGLPLTTLEIVEGAHIETHAVLSDGATLSSAGYPSDDLLRLQPMFLQVQTPAHGIQGRAFMLVAAEAEASDMGAALDWAASRVDVAIWCTRDWSKFEQSIWLKAPDALFHHALLVGHDADGFWQDHGFQAAFPNVGGCEGQDVQGYLRRMIDEAVAEDVDAADAFLQRYGVDDVQPKAQVLTSAPPATQAPRVCPEARRALGRLFQTLRTETRVLTETFEASDALTTMTALEDLFETLAFEAQEETIEDAWPDLSAQICAARDLAVLMRLEGEAAQAEDAAIMLVQVRQDIELRLAA